jgi:hypothetical protein
LTAPRDSTESTFRSGPSFGQWLGGVGFLANLALLFIDPLVLHEKVTMPDISLHIVGFGFCVYMIYPRATVALVTAAGRAVKDAIPNPFKWFAHL